MAFRAFCLFFFSFCLGASVYAWPPTYALELNLFSEELRSIFLSRQGAQTPTFWGEHSVATHVAAEIRKHCLPHCKIIEKNGKFGFTEWEFQFDSGLKFNVSVDPGTVEIQVGHFPLEQWKQAPLKADLQKYLFDLPKKLGLSHVVPESSLEGFGQANAHLNIGVKSAFGDDGKGLARFLADYWQHPELGTSLLGSDLEGAPLLGQLLNKQQNLAKQYIESYNRSPRPPLPGEVARDIVEKIYFSTPYHGLWGGDHYQALGLKYATELDKKKSSPLFDAPMELRPNREPLSADEAILQLELQEKRIEYLRSQSHQPLLLDLNLVSRADYFTPQENATAFYLYLDEMNLTHDFDKYAQLLPEAIRRTQPHRFLEQGLNWDQDLESQSFELFARRARLSPRMRILVEKALGDPRSSLRPEGRRIFETLVRMVESSRAAFVFPARDPLADMLMRLSEEPHWKNFSEISSWRKRFLSCDSLYQ